MFGDVFINFERFFTWYGFDLHLIRGLGLRATDDAGKDLSLVEEVERLAKELV